MQPEDVAFNREKEWMGGGALPKKKRYPICVPVGSFRPGLGVARTLRASPEHGLAQEACLGRSGGLRTGSQSGRV